MRQLLSATGGIMFAVSAVGLLISVIKQRSGRHVPIATAFSICLGAASLGAYSLGIEPFDVALFGSYVLTFVCWLPALVWRKDRTQPTDSEPNIVHSPGKVPRGSDSIHPDDVRP